MSSRDSYKLAKTMLGRAEGPDREMLMEYFENGGVNLDPQELAWCAAFVNATLGQTGEKGTGSPAARSFLDYGEKATVPGQGDIAVFKRGFDRRKGHVGFVDSIQPDGDINLLGGNQGSPGKVSIKPQSRRKLLDFRRPLGPRGPVQAAGGGLGSDTGSPFPLAPPASPDTDMASILAGLDSPPIPTPRPSGTKIAGRPEAPSGNPMLAGLKPPTPSPRPSGTMIAGRPDLPSPPARDVASAMPPRGAVDAAVHGGNWGINNPPQTPLGMLGPDLARNAFDGPSSPNPMLAGLDPPTPSPRPGNPMLAGLDPPLPEARPNPMLAGLDPPLPSERPGNPMLAGLDPPLPGERPGNPLLAGLDPPIPEFNDQKDTLARLMNRRRNRGQA